MNRARDLVSETPNTTLGIVGVMVILGALILLPRVFPASQFGVSCSALTNPIGGGNNGSLLSARSAEAISLQLTLQRRNISVNDSLVVNVTFVNDGVGSATLFIIPAEALLRSDGSQGLHFEIRRQPDGVVLAEPATIRPPIPQRQTFPTETLHVLGPGQRCTEQIEFNTVRLSSLGLQPGNYTIRAVYNNTVAGAWNIPLDATATPIFPDQGVFTAVGELRSNDSDFSVGLVQSVPAEGEAQPLGG